jgi:hypothetical protein
MGKPLFLKFYGLLLVLLTLFGTESSSAGVLVIDEAFTGRLIGLDLDFYEDKSGSLDFESIVQQEFVPNPYRVPAFGFAQSTYWYRLTLKNATAVQQRLFVELATSWIDHFSLFVEEEGVWVRRDAGVTTLIKDRSTTNNLPTHFFDLPAHVQQTIYLRIASSDSILLPIHLHSAASFSRHVRIKELLYGLFAGIMAVAAFYGLVFFVYTFNKAYLYYFMNTLSWLVMFAAWDGYVQEFFFQDSYFWNKRFNALMIASSLTWGSLFSARILEISSYSRTMNWVVRGWVTLQLVMAFLLLVLPYPPMMQVAAIIGLSFPLLLVCISIVALRQRMNIARNYLLSWSFPICGVIFYSGMVIGIVPGHPLVVYALHFAVLMQSLFLSFTLSYHLREATRNASVLKVSVEAAGLAHTSLMKNDLDPQCFELAYRYRPCEESGGDVFSCMEDPRGLYSYIVVGDVSGHGISAAIISSAFTGALHAAVKGLNGSSLNLEDSCRKILDDVNQVMCDYFPRTNHHASAALVGMELSTGKLIYINAGHRNIFLKSGDKVSAILRGGSLMGLPFGSTLSAMSLNLAENDMLFLYTDGLLENDFGVSQKARIDVIVNSMKNHHVAQQVLDSIWQGIVTDKDGYHYDDDMTLLVIKLTSLKKAA